MPKRSEFKTVIINQKDYNTLLRWSLCLTEVGGLCFGKDNTIKYVERLTNQLNMKHYYMWDNSERRQLIVEYQKRGLDLVAEFHSHGATAHMKTPSPADTQYFQAGLPHLICFPIENIIRCWLMSKNLNKVRRSNIDLHVISRDMS